MNESFKNKMKAWLLPLVAVGINDIWPPFKTSKRAKKTAEESALNLQKAQQKRDRKNAKRIKDMSHEN